MITLIKGRFSRRTFVFATISLTMVVLLFFAFSRFFAPESADVQSLITASKNGDNFWIIGNEPSKKLAKKDLHIVVQYIVSHQDQSSYHLLLRLRLDYPQLYSDLSNECKAAVLCSALSNLKTLNDWSILDPAGSNDDIAAQALLETGSSAINSLLPILSDRSQVLLEGSRETTLSIAYHYRRADFAYRYYLLILGDQPCFHPQPEQRDLELNKLKMRLRQQEG